MIIVWSIFLKVVANYGASRWHKGYRWTHPLMCNHTTIIRHNICDSQHSSTCNLLYPFLIIRCEPFEVLWSHAFEIYQLDQYRHFAIPSLMHHSLHAFVLDNYGDCFTFVDKSNCIVNKASSECGSVQDFGVSYSSVMIFCNSLH